MVRQSHHKLVYIFSLHRLRERGGHFHPEVAPQSPGLEVLALLSYYSAQGRKDAAQYYAWLLFPARIHTVSAGRRHAFTAHF
jgi:hypothetical protein